MTAIKSLLLLGPPGAGKSPLSQYLGRQLLSGRRFLSFDFGQELRHILETWSEQTVPTGRLNGLQISYDSQEIERICQTVEKGILFEESDRELTRKILTNFLNKNSPSATDILVLNGLPRHEGQVAWLEGLTRIVLAVNLDCPEEISIRRILANLDGDRTSRADDRPEMISHRYHLYEERTKPLLSFLTKQGIPVIALTVNETIRPELLWQKLFLNEAFNRNLING